MAMAAATELAQAAEAGGLSEVRIVPRMDEWEVVPRVAVATAMQAQQEGVPALTKTADQLHREASSIIERARETTHVLMREGIIANPSDGSASQ